MPPEDHATEVSYMLNMEPIEPQVQKIKKAATDQSRNILKGTGMGKKRIEKIIPRLIEVLSEPPRRLTDVEATFIQAQFERWLESNKKK